MSLVQILAIVHLFCVAQYLVVLELDRLLGAQQEPRKRPWTSSSSV